MRSCTSFDIFHTYTHTTYPCASMSHSVLFFGVLAARVDFGLLSNDADSRMLATWLTGNRPLIHTGGPFEFCIWLLVSIFLISNFRIGGHRPGQSNTRPPTFPMDALEETMSACGIHGDDGREVPHALASAPYSWGIGSQHLDMSQSARNMNST